MKRKVNFYLSRRRRKINIDEIDKQKEHTMENNSSSSDCFDGLTMQKSTPVEDSQNSL